MQMHLILPLRREAARDDGHLAHWSGVDEMPPRREVAHFCTSSLLKSKMSHSFACSVGTDFVMHSDTLEPILLLQALVEVSLSGGLLGHARVVFNEIRELLRRLISD
jgi:hypothetical protein